MLPTDCVMSMSVQLLAEKAREQPKPDVAPMSALSADAPAPAAAAVAAASAAPAAAAAAAMQPHAEGIQQSPAVLAPAAQQDLSTAWKLEKMEAQVWLLCMLCFGPSQLLMAWIDISCLTVLAAMSGTSQLAKQCPCLWLSWIFPFFQLNREAVGILQAWCDK